MNHDDSPEKGAGEDEDFAALFAAAERTQDKRPRRVKLGDSVTGRVVSVGPAGAFVDMGVGASEALLPYDEIRDEAGHLTVQVGDEVSARVVELEGKTGCPVLRRSMAKGAVGSAELQQAARLGLAVEGTVTGVNKGGVEVQVAGVRGFCPISQLELRHVEDPTPYVGQKLRFAISKYETDARGVNLVVSRRALLEVENRERAKETRAKLTPGAVMTGTVTSLRDFGAFVDLGGIDGLLPASEIGYKRGTKPSDVLAVGQVIEVQVLRVEETGDGKRPEKVSLSLKALAPDPFHEAVLKPGARVQGTVTRLEAFGAFAEVAPGVEGLVHISELGRDRSLRHARDAVKVGDVLELTVLAVDADKRRISLGTGTREDAVDPEALAAFQSASGGRLGTLGDLFKKKG